MTMLLHFTQLLIAQHLTVLSRDVSTDMKTDICSVVIPNCPFQQQKSRFFKAIIYEAQLTEVLAVDVQIDDCWLYFNIQVCYEVTDIYLCAETFYYQQVSVIHILHCKFVIWTLYPNRNQALIQSI